MKKATPPAKPRAGSYHHGDLKRALIDAAIHIINRHGRRALTLRAVAAAAGVSKNAPYRHFTNKEALLAAVAEEGFRELTRRMEETARRTDDPLERIIQESHVYVSFALGNPAQFDVMFGFDLMSFAQHPTLLQTASVSAQHLLDLVRQCQEAGIVRQGDVVRLAFGAWTLIHGFATLAVNGLVPFPIGKEHELQEILREYAMSYLEGMQERT